MVDALRRGAGLQDAEALVSIGASVDALAYRATVRAAVDASGRAGFRRLRSHGVVVSGACPVADRRIADVLEHGRFPGVDEILLRVSERTGEVVVSPGMTGIGITVPVGVRVGDENDQMSETVAGVELRVSMGSFFQSSAEAANLLVEAVAAALGVPAAPSGLHPVRSGLLVDLYGGIGLFAATLGRAYGRVVVVEHAARAASDARVNVATHARAEVVVTDVDEWRPTPTIHGELSGHGPGQIDVVADPARRGLGRGGVATIAALRPQVVVLVSCDAAALGRDARLLAGEGWALEHTTVLDLFPHTHHLEAVSRFVAR